MKIENTSGRKSKREYKWMKIENRIENRKYNSMKIENRVENRKYNSMKSALLGHRTSKHFGRAGAIPLYMAVHVRVVDGIYIPGHALCIHRGV